MPAPAWAEGTTSVTLEYAESPAEEHPAPSTTEQNHTDASPFPKTGDASGVVSALAFLGAAAAGAALLKASCYEGGQAGEGNDSNQKEACP